MKVLSTKLILFHVTEAYRFLKNVNKYFRLVGGSNHCPWWSHRYNARTKSEGAVVRSPNQTKIFFSKGYFATHLIHFIELTIFCKKKGNEKVWLSLYYIPPNIGHTKTKNAGN